MEACLDGALSVGGDVRTVILEKFSHKAYPLKNGVRVVDNMTDRKRGLMELSDFIVVLPGGKFSFKDVSGNDIFLYRRFWHLGRSL
jgi:predicted Rossmann-fold nucleotide-binding protein